MAYGSTDKRYADNGDRVDLVGTYQQLSTSLYSEYGVTSRVAAYGSFSFFRRDHLDAVELTATGIGDLTAGVRVNLWPNRPLALLSHRFPTAPDDAEDGRLPLGPGDHATQAALAYGGALGFWALSGEILAGYTVRRSGYDDEATYSGSLYKPLGERWLVSLQATVLQSLGNGRAGAGPRSLAGTYLNGTSFIAWGPRVGYRINDQWGLQLELDAASRARNIHSGIFPRLAISYKGS